MAAWWADVQDAWRAVWRTPGVSLVVVATLGAGLALCLLVLTVAHAYVGRSLPYPHADRLYNVSWSQPGQRTPRGLDQLDWSAVSDVVEHAVAWDLDVFYLLGGSYPEAAPGAWVTPGFSEALGVRVLHGRGLEAGDFEPGRPPVVLISHRLWHTRFAADPAIVGRTFDAYVSDRPDEPEQFTIVGVLPPGFWHVNDYTDVLAPLTAPAYPYMVRGRAGVGPDAVSARLTALVRSGASDVPDEWRVVVMPVQQAYTAVVRPLLWAVGAAAVLVLLIACANVAILLLVRNHRRQPEASLRLALGASRWRIVRGRAIEAAILGAAAMLVGLAASITMVSWMAPAVERPLGRSLPGGLASLAPDGTLIAMAVGVGLVTTFVFSVIPLLTFGTWRASGFDFGRTSTEAPGARRFRDGLLTLEVAASLALVVGALLVVDSARRMVAVELGVNTNVVFAGVGLRDGTYPDAESRAAFYARLLPRVQSLVPGGGVAASDWWPLQPPRPHDVETMDDRRMRGRAGLLAVSAGYFAVLDVAIRDGRAIDESDVLGRTAVAVISESLARRLWPSGSAVGQMVRASTVAGSDADAPLDLTVIGVAADVRQSHADAELEDVYVSLHQRPNRFGYVYVRGAGADGLSAHVLRETAAGAGRDAAVGEPQVLATVARNELARPLWLAGVLTAFAAAAAGLALLGLYGAMAYAVRQREREVAIRMALGAGRGAVAALFVRQGLSVLGIGLLLGVAGALGLGRLLASQLFGVSPAEPTLLLTALIIVIAGGAAAIYRPAVGATTIDAAERLKQD